MIKQLNSIMFLLLLQGCSMAQDFSGQEKNLLFPNISVEKFDYCPGPIIKSYDGAFGVKMGFSGYKLGKGDKLDVNKRDDLYVVSKRDHPDLYIKFYNALKESLTEFNQPEKTRQIMSFFSENEDTLIFISKKSRKENIGFTRGIWRGKEGEGGETITFDFWGAILSSKDVDVFYTMCLVSCKRINRNI